MELIPDKPKLKDEHPKCCDKEMYHQSGIDTCYPNTDDIERWVCLDCGKTIVLSVGGFDEEELEDFKKGERIVDVDENNPEENR